jgi:hypothetical protein
MDCGYPAAPSAKFGTREGKMYHFINFSKLPTNFGSTAEMLLSLLNIHLSVNIKLWGIAENNYWILGVKFITFQSVFV